MAFWLWTLLTSTISAIIGAIGFFIIGFVMSVVIFFLLAIALVIFSGSFKRLNTENNFKAYILKKIFSLSAINGIIYAVVMAGLLLAFSSSTSEGIKLGILITQLGSFFLPTIGTVTAFIFSYIKDYKNIK